HRAENADDEIKGLVRHLLQIRCVAFLEFKIAEALLRRPPVSSLHQVARDIDTKHVCAKFRRGQRGRAIATAEIQHLHSFPDSESLHERLTALAHRVSDARKIAFFPE